MIWKTLSLFAVLIFNVALMAQQQSTSHTATVVIRAGTLIDGSLTRRATTRSSSFRGTAS